MRVPYTWLKDYVNVDAPVAEVAHRLTMGGLEVEGIEDSAVGPVIDVYVTPNRGDCNSILGVAREVAALYDLKLVSPAATVSLDGGQTAGEISVSVSAPDLCPRYAARVVRGVRIGPSPQWMQDRLEAAGQRPINNVVDVTNYVLLEVGQPLHAFDLAKLGGQRIVVRRAAEGETIATLDGAVRELTSEMLVIADDSRPVAVAGIMGGAETEVDAGTTDILIESAHFNPLSVRRTSRALGLRTEASYRFERFVDPDGVRRAADRACLLLTQMGMPEAIDGIVDVYPGLMEARTIRLRVRRAAELLGMEISSHSAADCLRRLGFNVITEPHGDADSLKVHVPSFRSDIAIEEDLVEEVGRIYGYENIPETLPRGDTTQGGDSAEGRFLRRIRERLVSGGLQEVITHSLTAPAFFEAPGERVDVRNALSADIGGLRASLIPTLLGVARLNCSRGRNAAAIFEIGRVWRTVDDVPVESISIGGVLAGAQESGWQPDAKSRSADFYTVRGVVERLLAGLGIGVPELAPPRAYAPVPAVAMNGNSLLADGEVDTDTDYVPLYHPGRVAELTLLNGAEPDGIIGEIHPIVQEKLELRDRVYAFELKLDSLTQSASTDVPRFHALSRYPAVARDIAPRVDEGVPYGSIEDVLRDAARDMETIEEFRLVDVYVGPGVPEGQKSYTLSITFRSTERTLSDTEVNSTLAGLRTALEERCGATFVG